MKVIVVGTGYVGLVTGACLADVGITVNCIDIDAVKVDRLKKGIMPIHEPGLEQMVKVNLEKGRIRFDTSLKDHIDGASVIFIAVGTPPGEDGSADMQYVISVAKEIGTHLKDYALIVTKSTVPVGSSEKVRAAVQNAIDKREVIIPFDVASNPEFLKEGAAIKDFMSPDRIVVGIDTPRAKKTIDMLYHPFLLNGYRLIYMDIASAEMTKYAANAMLATRISFMNDMANLCEKLGADINQVRMGIGTDPRIGKKFLYSGAGYGGSCFPKDVKALVKMGKEHGYALNLLEAVEKVNENQKRILFDKIECYFDGDLKGKTIAIWGLAFKPNTNDMREAPALVIIEELLNAGVTVNVFDPIAMPEAREILADTVCYCKDIYETTKEADAIVLITEWNEFRLPDWKKVHTNTNRAVMFDGRNIYDPNELINEGFEYFGIGRSPVMIGEFNS